MMEERKENIPLCAGSAKSNRGLFGGRVLDADKTSFTGYMQIPVRHGMTLRS